MTTKRLRIRGSKEQVAFVNASKDFPAFVGGFGSGKTEALILRAIKKKLEYPALNIAYYLPTYDLVDQIGFPRFEEKLAEFRLKYRLNKHSKTITVRYGGTSGNIIFRTLDKPERIIGYEVADSLVDELDTLKTAKAKNCWDKIIARNRQKKPDGKSNTVGVGTTPEGFRFVYARWSKPSPSYQLIQAPTESNSRNLPAGYIDQLRETYPVQLLEAYINGRFVNLTSGVVYTSFDRVKNNTTVTPEPGEPLHIGMDFNVYNMSAVVHVIRGGSVYAVGEITGIRDTPAMIEAIGTRYPNREITIYPDASGKAAKTTNASVSDLTLLIDAGLKVKAPAANPPVKDRVISVNAMFCNGEGLRRYLVNVADCPVYTEDLEQLAYDDGVPDKKSGKDHRPDAAGYFIYYVFPVRGKPTITRVR
jgi:hypothetical protein